MKKLFASLACGLLLFTLAGRANTQFIVHVPPVVPPVTPPSSTTVCNTGTVRFVKTAATGSGTGLDWTNAMALPVTPTRGVTYCVATGTYPTKTFSTAASGSTVITIRGATTTDHGTDVGWSNAFGVDTTQATWGNPTFSTGFWVFDGAVGELVSTRATYGFAITRTLAGSANAAFFIDSASAGVPNLTVAHTAMQSPAGDQEKTAIRGTTTHNYINLTVQSCLLDNFEGGVVSEGGTNTGWLIERTYFLNGFSSPAHHGEDINPNSGAMSGAIIRYNIFDGTDPIGDKTGTIVANNSDNVNAQIYGNVFTGQITGNGMITGTSQGNMTGAVVYNNTIIDNDPTNGGGGTGCVFSGPGTGDIAQNNIIANQSAQNCGFTSDYNLYISGTGAPAETHGQTSASSTFFVNRVGKDYHLTVATTTGNPLSSPFNQDRFGNTRGADGVWDRGAFEFCAGGCTFTQVFSPRVVWAFLFRRL